MGHFYHAGSCIRELGDTCSTPQVQGTGEAMRHNGAAVGAEAAAKVAQAGGSCIAHTLLAHP